MLSFKDFIRFRAIYCYLLLWITLLIFGLYKYVSSDTGMQTLISKSSHTNYLNNQQLLEHENIKGHSSKHHQLYCNAIDNLIPAEEGGTIEGWSLQGENRQYKLQNNIHKNNTTQHSSIVRLDLRNKFAASNDLAGFHQII